MTRLIAILVTAVQCRQEGMDPLPVLAVVTGNTPASRLAIEDVARSVASRHLAIRVLVDSEAAPGGERADDEVERAERLVQQSGLFGVVGHQGSRGSLAAAPVYNRAEVVQLVPTATSRLLRNAGPWTFTLAANDSLEGAVLGQFATEYLGARRVTLFYVPDEYGRGLRAGVLRELRRRDVEVADNVPVAGEADLETLLTSSLARAPTDLILSLCPSHQTGLLARIALAVRPGLRVLAGDAAVSLPELTDAAGKAGDSIYVASFWLPPGDSEMARAWSARFQAAAGRSPTAGDALTYDAIMLLATAARSVGPSRTSVRAFLEQLAESRPAFEGVTGPISFGPIKARPVIIARLRNRKLERVTWP
jgi:branched-chain amino acid transport system substrate-binding protein